MSNHLSEHQFARCLTGQATNAELLHSRECPECSVELNLFTEAISLFQGAVREKVDDRIARTPSFVHSKPSGARTQTQRWVLVAVASAVLILLPFIRIGNKPEDFPEPFTKVDADAVMNRVNLHLTRTVPAPMEPLLLGLPDMNP